MAAGRNLHDAEDLLQDVASLLLTDQTANWCTAIFLTDHKEADRDLNRRPQKK